MANRACLRRAAATLPHPLSSLKAANPTPPQLRWLHPGWDCSNAAQSAQCTFGEALPFALVTADSIFLRCGFAAKPAQRHQKIPIGDDALANAAAKKGNSWIRIYSCILKNCCLLCLPKLDMCHDFDSIASAQRSRSPWRGRRRPPLKTPKPTETKAGASDYNGKTTKTECSFYRRPGKPPQSLGRRSTSYFSLTRLRDSLMRNAGPNFLMFKFGWNNSSVRTSKTFAKMYNSPSGTRRCSVSSLASDSLLMSQPNSCSFADKSYCVQPLRSRILRTCRPIKFSGIEACLMRNTVPKQSLKKCSIQVTINRLPKGLGLDENRFDSRNGKVNERLNQFSSVVRHAATGTVMSREPQSSSVACPKRFLKESSSFQRISSGNVCRHVGLICGIIKTWWSMPMGLWPTQKCN